MFLLLALCNRFIYLNLVFISKIKLYETFYGILGLKTTVVVLEVE